MKTSCCADAAHQKHSLEEGFIAYLSTKIVKLKRSHEFIMQELILENWSPKEFDTIKTAPEIDLRVDDIFV